MNNFFFELAQDLIGNGTLILALCFLYRLLVQRLGESGMARSIATGLLFGAAAVSSMLIAVEYRAGIIFDGRTIMLSLGALHGGPLAAGIAGSLAVAYRGSLGGAGTFIGILVITMACLMGLAARRLFKGDGNQSRGWRLLLLGFAVHIVAIVLFLALPLASGSQIAIELGPAYLAILTLGTWILGLLLHDVDRYHHFEQLLRQSRDRFEFLFQSTATALLDEDLSEVYRTLDQLRAEGVTDLRVHLQENPEVLSTLIHGVHVRAVNPAALKLFDEDSERGLMQGIDRHFAPDSAHTFLEGLCAYWEGRDWLHEETRMARRDGSLFQALLAMPIPRSPEQASHVPVNIIDVTPLRHRERELREQQEYLEGVLWGTDAGTWEWHLPSNQLRLNQRWSSLLGYNDMQPPPTCFDERRKLVHPTDRDRSDHLLGQVVAGKLSSYECELRMLRADNEWQWMLERGKITSYDAGGKPLRLSGILMDIDARRRAVDRATRLAAVREALLYCHEELLSAESEQAIFERTVRALVRTRGYRLAWLGKVRPAAHHHPARHPEFEILARAGEAIDLDGSLNEFFTLPDSQEQSPLPPFALAAMSGEVQVVDNLVDGAQDAPWKDRARQLNLHAAMIIPIPRASGTLILCLYSDLPGLFVDDERRLLEDFTRSLTLALESRQNLQ